MIVTQCLVNVCSWMFLAWFLKTLCPQGPEILTSVQWLRSAELGGWEAHCRVLCPSWGYSVFWYQEIVAMNASQLGWRLQAKRLGTRGPLSPVSHRRLTGSHHSILVIWVPRSSAASLSYPVTSALWLILISHVASGTEPVHASTTLDDG